MIEVKGRPFLTFRWVDQRSDLVFNREGSFKLLAKGGQNDLVRTQLIDESTLERYIREGKAVRA